MSDQEKKNNVSASRTSPMVVVEQSAGSRHKQPYRTSELQEEASQDLHHKRSKTPAVLSVAEELKKLTAVSTTENTVQDRKESERGLKTITSEKQSILITKKTLSKHHDLLSEEIALAILEKEPKNATTTPTQPIPPQVESEPTTVAAALIKNVESQQSEDEDSITHELAEAGPRTEWSEDDEAGGLSRSESRASRVSRAMRHLLCCGSTNNRKCTTPTKEEKLAPEIEAKKIDPTIARVKFSGNDLVTKSSLGPLHRSTGDSGLQRPSGIFLNVPKSTSCVQEIQNANKPSGISIKVSRKASCRQKDWKCKEQYFREDLSAIEDGTFCKIFNVIRNIFRSFQDKK